MNTTVDIDTQLAWSGAWKEVDASMKKKLSLNDLRDVFLLLGEDLSQKELSECCKGGKECSFEQFIEFLDAKPKQGVDSASIKHSVTVLSMYTGGQLKTAELRLLLTNQGEKLNNNEAAALVSDADPYKTGFVDTDAFCTRIGAK